MGLCLGSEVTDEGKMARIHSSQIDRDLYEYAKREMNVVKILMLGKTCPMGLMFTWACLYIRNLILGTFFGNFSLLVTKRLWV